MNRNLLNVLTGFCIIIFIIILAPVITYLIGFWGHSFSNKNQDWANFGNYINGVLGPIIALTGALITLALGFLTTERNRTLIERETMKHRPLLEVFASNFDNKIEINLKNKGLGPLLVTDYKINNVKTGESKGGLYYWIQNISGTFNNYTGELNDLILAPSEVKNLLLFEKQDMTKIDTDYHRVREELRIILKDLEIEIGYNDIYNNEMPTRRYKFDWYGKS